jgi:uncharacterized protein (DUF302 family)
MYYIVDTEKSVYEASVDLGEVVLRLGFSVLHVDDLGEELRRKGIEFDDEAMVFDIWSPRQSERMLGLDVRLSLLSPCRIGIFTENGNTRIGLARPEALLAAASTNPEVARLARELEEKLVQIVDEAR